jgi:anti-repressor protein
MEELIRITERDGRKVVSARELYVYLTNDVELKNVNQWMQRNISNNDFAIIDIDYQTIRYVNEYGRGIVDSALTIDFAKELCMLSQCENGKQARQYFIACENKLKEIVQHQLPKSFAEALQLAADQAKQIELQGCQIKELEPKAEVYDNISNAGNLLSMNDAAKSLSWGRNNFIKRLKSLKILMTSGRPYQQFLDQGYFEVKINPIVKGGIIDNYSQTFVTGKGITWLSKIKI